MVVPPKKKKKIFNLFLSGQYYNQPISTTPVTKNKSMELRGPQTAKKSVKVTDFAQKNRVLGLVASTIGLLCWVS